MGQGRVQLGDGRFALRVQVNQDVGFALRDRNTGTARNLDGNAMRGPVHVGDQLQLHIDNNTTIS